MKEQQLIARYEDNLKKVITSWEGLGERGQEYIKYAQDQLNAVKDGGMIGLLKFWETNKEEAA